MWGTSDFSKYTDVDVRPYSVSSIESKYQLTRYYCLQWTLNQTQLRQREIVTTYPQEQERILISSITKNLEKSCSSRLTFKVCSPFWVIPVGPLSTAGWTGSLIGCVRRWLSRLGTRSHPEAEFQLMFVELGEEVYRGSFIPTFKEKGRVRVVEVFSSKVREWPSWVGVPNG